MPDVETVKDSYGMLFENVQTYNRFIARPISSVSLANTPDPFHVRPCIPYDVGWRTSNAVEDPPSNSVHGVTPSKADKTSNMLTGRILVVEDESIVALDIRNTLLRFGHTVVALTSNGPDAIAQARQHHPDLILMDIRLQGSMTGIEAAEVIMHDLKIPIIYMTAQTDPATRARAEITMPAGYLVKPFVKHELASLIVTVLSRGTH